MKLIFTFLLALFTFGFSYAQLLGIYEFNGLGACPNQSPNVTLPLVNSEFDDFSLQNVFCVSTQQVYNTKSWNTSPILNESEFIQFGIHTVSCYRINLDSISFDFRNTPAGNTPTWHLRSSIDNFASDIATGLSATSSTMFSDTIVLNQTTFSLLADVKFRIYLTEMGSAGAAFRIDNVQFYGNEQLVGTVDYYVDLDGDGYGTGLATPACSNPGGYSLNDIDCDDNNVAINPNTFWYSDNDGDGFGNDLNFEIGCVSTLPNPVTNSDDCNDASLTISPNTIWFQDIDNDGFGDDLTTETACVSTLTNATMIAGDCNDTVAAINPNTTWYPDGDGDGFGDPNYTEIGCVTTFFVPVLIGMDCDDARDDINPNATEICDEIDNNCNGLNNEGLPTTVYYIDMDDDGYGGGSAGDSFCDDPGVDYSSVGGDCDDENATINPGSTFDDTDVCGDLIDNDCDGMFDEGYDEFLCNGGGGETDLDGDGYDAFSDCNDNNAAINPGAIDIPNNGIDENCDGQDLVNGITENSNSNLKIYPNPGSDKVFISSESMDKGENVIVITDVNGKVVFELKMSVTSLFFCEIPTVSFSKGVYQICVSSEKSVSRAIWLKI